MNQLWTSQALIEAMAGRPAGTMPVGVDGISIDTRTLQKGDAFFAIRGDRFDGHDFATAAMAAGAALLVVAEGKLPALGRLNVPKIVVPDVQGALERLGMAARDRTSARIVAITGSAGKTSTKDALRHALAPSGKVHGADKSFNNHWGVPLTLARMPADSDFAVFELGMNHAGEISALTRQVRPDIAIITLIAAAHLGHFNSLDEIARAKAEIFEGVMADGHALLNRDDARWKLLDAAAKAAGIKNVWSFGQHQRATFKLKAYQADATGATIMAGIAGKDMTVRLGVPGEHIAQNAMAVLGAAYLAGADVEQAAASLATLKAPEGRGQRHVLQMPGGAFTLIDESYNANPASMRAALAALAATPVGEGGRRIAVLGDMLELGAHSERLHSALAEIASPFGIDRFLVAGPEMKAFAGKLGDAPVDALLPLVMEAVKPGDVMMVKSSNGIGFSRIVRALIDRFQPAPGARQSAGAAQEDGMVS
jgi:UDP-N-acetylmuramoyl-tripeptide--D-alanyl-D-alanine ligase